MIRSVVAVLAAAALVAPLAPAAAAQSRDVGTVVIANGWSAADSAVASALAALEGSGSSSAAVLYATTEDLTSRTAGFIADRKPSKVILVGGTKALSAAVAAEAERLTAAAPTRISGADRFDTAAKAVPSTATTFVVANGYSAADTGVAAALAAVTRNAAVLLATADSLTPATEQVIRERQPSQVVFVGGTAVLGESLADRVRELAPRVTSVPRHSGSSRTHTAAAAAPTTATTLVIANGWSAADSGVAAALAATTGNAAVLYARATSLTSPTVNRISELQPRAVVLVGGTSALGSVLIASIHCAAPGATISRVSGADRIDTAVRAASGSLTRLNTNYECGAGGGGGGGGGGGAPTDPPSLPAGITPSAPNSLGVVPTDKALELSWRVPGTTGGVITAYTIQYRTQDTDSVATGNQPGDWVIASTTTTGTSLTVNGPTQASGPNAGAPATTASLVNGTAYDLRVRAHNTNGGGAWSALAEGTPENTPGAPGGLTIEPGDQSLEVEWDVPTQTGGSAITDYDVQYRACTSTDNDTTDFACDGTTNNWGSWTEWNASNASTALKATITGLTNGTAHQVQVRAGNAIGDGDWSASASDTPDAVPAKLAVAPSVTRGDRQLSVSWTAPTGVITDYDVRYRAQNGSWVNRSGETSSDTTASATLASLTNGTTYEVQVRSANSVGESPWSRAASGTPAGKPKAPTGLDVEIVSGTSLKASWTAADGNGAAITDYDVEYRACTNTSDLTCATNATWALTWTEWNASNTSTATSATITGLTSGTKYQVQVHATNAVGDSAYSSSASGIPDAVPAAPAAPTVTSGNRQLSVSWTAPNNGGTAISDYDVRYRACTATPKTCTSSPAWGSWRSHAHTGTGTTAAAITGLTNGTAYQVQVRATNSAGTGAYSPSGSSTPAGAPTVAPTNLTTTRGNAMLSLAWSAPFDNGSPITGYAVRYCGITDSEDCSDYSTWQGWGNAVPATALALQPPPNGLTNGVTYRWQVRADNILGQGPWSSTASGVPATTPGEPDNVQLTGANRGLTVSWSAPQVDGGLAVTDYDVQYRITDTDSVTGGDQPGSWTAVAHQGTSLSASIAGLTNGTEYDVQVRASNSVGAGPWSDEQSDTAGGAPLAPAAPTVASGDQQLTVSWTAPSANGGGDITGYGIEYRARDTNLWIGDGPTTVTTTHTIGLDANDNGTLTNGTVYEVRVRAANPKGNGPWSPVSTGKPAGTPGAPATVTAVPANGSITVNWSAPDANGATVTGFKVRRCTGDSDCDEASDVLSTVAVSGATARSHTFSSLTNGTRYDMQVQTVSSDEGDSAWSDVASTQAGGPPGAPTGLSATAGNASITLSWDPPSDNGGFLITGYAVQYCDNSTGCDAADEWTTADTSVTSQAHTISSLTNGTTYRLRVNAHNQQRGSGPWSSTVTAKPATTPSAPASVTLRAGNASLTVSWTVAAPVAGADWTNGSAVTGFQIRHCDNESGDCSDDSSNWTTVTVTGSSARSSTLTGLTNGAEYNVEVRVTSSDQGNSAWTAWTQSNDSDGSSRPGTPAAPSLSLTAGDQRLEASWTAPANRGSEINGYELQFCKITDTVDCTQPQQWTNDHPSGTGTSHTVGLDTTNTAYLTNGATYKVRLRASNGRGWSPWSAVVTGVPSAS